MIVDRAVAPGCPARRRTSSSEVEIAQNTAYGKKVGDQISLAENSVLGLSVKIMVEL